MWVVCCSNCTWVRKKTNWLFTGNQNRILNPKTTNNLGTRGRRFNWEGGREGGREREKILFSNGKLNLLLQGSGCPLQAGTGHGQSGRAPG
jgi:hypothetical protein